MVDGSSVRVQNMPTDGEIYRAFASSSDSSYGWNITVDVDDTNQTFTIHHQLDASSALSVKGIDETSTKFYVKSVDEAAGTAVIDRNNQIIGQDLTFVVTLVSIG
jgi:FKBP-type peptidyl-prolyl cis-trans isomerase 2